MLTKTFVSGKDGIKHVGYSRPVMEPKLALCIEMLLNDEPIAAVNDEC